MILFILINAVFAHAASLTYFELDSVDSKRFARELILQLPGDQKSMSPDRGKKRINLSGHIHILVSSHELLRTETAAKYARVLTGEGTNLAYFDLAFARVTFDVNHELFELVHVGGQAPQYPWSTFARVSLDDGRAPNAVNDCVSGVLRQRLLAVPQQFIETPSRGFLFDVSLMNIQEQTAAIATLRSLLSNPPFTESQAYQRQANVYVLCHALGRPDPSATQIRFPGSAPSHIEFQANPRYGVDEHLTYFSRHLPLPNFTLTTSGVRLLGMIKLDDRHLSHQMQKSLRQALSQVLKGKRRIAGATYNAKSARVVWDSDVCASRLSRINDRAQKRSSAIK